MLTEKYKVKAFTSRLSGLFSTKRHFIYKFPPIFLILSDENQTSINPNGTSFFLFPSFFIEFSLWDRPHQFSPLQGALQIRSRMHSRDQGVSTAPFLPAPHQLSPDTWNVQFWGQPALPGQVCLCFSQSRFGCIFPRRVSSCTSSVGAEQHSCLEEQEHQRLVKSFMGNLIVPCKRKVFCINTAWP